MTARVARTKATRPAAKDGFRAQLRALSRVLRDVHKSLVVFSRDRYETENGLVRGKGQLFDLLLQGGKLEAYDGGESYQLFNYAFWKILYYPPYERWAITAVGTVGVGYYRGWFQVSTGSTAGQSNATITVDRDKIQADQDKLKKQVQDVAKNVGDRTAKGKDEARAP